MSPSNQLLPADGANERRWYDEIVVRLGDRDIDMLLVSDGDALVGTYFGPAFAGPAARASEWTRDRAHLASAADQLRAYAAAELTEFDLPLRPSGTTFRRDVWAALTAIPYGTTTTYGKIAAEVGRPTGSRAVGAAVGANPIGIVIPCHRVVGADGSLTGYGGGLDNKVALLRLEGVSAL
jgi:methylated-DNA-[protein]-cysteine S-methyltransferase